MITKKKNHGVKRIWGGFPERRAIGEIKNNKAEGIDNIPIEMLKTFSEKAMKELVKLCKEIYNTGVWAEDFLQTVMVPLKKKPNAMTSEDHRTISLLTHASKNMLRVLTKRLQSRAKRDNCIGEDQYGFRKGKGTRDAIGALRVLTERSLQQKHTGYLLRPRAHGYELPAKDEHNFISRMLYKNIYCPK